MTDVEKALEEWDMEHDENVKEKVNDELEEMIGESLSAEIVDTNKGIAVRVLLPSSERLAYTMLLSTIESIGSASGSSFEEVILKIETLKESGLVEKAEVVEK
jgi:hypothetical protein